LTNLIESIVTIYNNIIRGSSEHDIVTALAGNNGLKLSEPQDKFFDNSGSDIMESGSNAD
jgi:hypothetical protein